MARVPRQETITLAAGQTKPFPVHGKWLTILSMTVATVDVAFDGTEYAPMWAGVPYPATDGDYHIVRFRESTGAAATLVVLFSDQQAPDNRFSPLAAAMAASLAAIDADMERLKPADTLTIVDRTVVAQTGVGSTQILAANPNRKWCLVTMDLGNAGNVYLGKDNTVTAAANSFFDSMAGGSWREHYTGAVWACSQNGTEAVRAYEST